MAHPTLKLLKPLPILSTLAPPKPTTAQRLGILLVSFIVLTAGATMYWGPVTFKHLVKQLYYEERDLRYRYEGLAESKATAAATTMHQMLAATPASQQSSTATNGPLRISAANSRYFADASGQIVYLTGSHTWANLQDNGGADPPPRFDYNQYLDFLQANNHNFFRLWSWEESRWTTETADPNYWFNPPPPFQRTGPALALDGKPKFDLTKLEQSYFDRMRERIQAARARGIYVSIMLFNGWSVASAKGGLAFNNPWQGHPLNGANNVNGLDGDANGDNSGEEVHTLVNPAITAVQEAYVKKVIDTVNDLDNVLYEISNESDGSSSAWQYHLINFIKAYEATKPYQHPVGMSVEYFGGDNETLFNSPADWIAPNGPLYDPMTGDGRKVVLHDTDHLCGICGDRQWVWMAFTRGLNPIFMDGYDGAGYGVGGAGLTFDDPTWVSLRKNLGYTRSFADRMNLAAMTPQNALASTGYALAQPNSPAAEFLVYLPAGGTVSVNLSSAAGQLTVAWFNPATGESSASAAVNGGATRQFAAPFSGDAVLYLTQRADSFTPTPTPTLTTTVTQTRSHTPTASATPIPSATPTPIVHSTPTATATPNANQPTPIPCWPTGIPAGAIAGQPPPVFCRIDNSGPDTSSQESNSWFDRFDHHLSFGNFAGVGYRLFESMGVHQSLHWRHADHWMVDIAPDAPEQTAWNDAIGGAMLRPARTFRFQDGLLRVDTDYAAGIPAYGASAWGEIIITTGDHPVYQGNPAGEATRNDTLYGYDLFPNHWTLGCRLQADSHTTCSLMQNNALGPNNGGRRWEISFFQVVGETNMGGFSDGAYYRFCREGDPDLECRDRFRLELTRTSLTIHANGVKYFEQTGLPPLPDELINGDLYIYLASIVNHAEADTVRFHWDNFAINSPAPPSAAPAFHNAEQNAKLYLPINISK
ncbi:MAG: hypothetical protein DYG89_08485 [Caldilinea sp. CFX5]|nr:hypothetical protein [Caldilinea sp. CFX5]